MLAGRGNSSLAKGATATSWFLSFPPRRWQEIALELWLRRKRGIVEVVTGGGKTVFAFQCIQALQAADPNLKFLIVVPSIALLDQWVLALQEELQVPEEEIGILGGGEKPSPTARVVVAVLNSARKFSSEFAERSPTFLIVDECHRAGSPINAQAMDGRFVATLGLSATPEREYDGGFQEHIVPALGEILYRYDYVEAAHDQVIAPFSLINIEIPMQAGEQYAYDDFTRRIGVAGRMAQKDAAGEERLKRLLIQRAAVVNMLVMRVPAAVRLLDGHRQERAIVFHERVPQARRIYELLKERGHNAVLYHAGIEAHVRREDLRRFRRGLHDVLVCCRALDEGMNAPETSVAVVASSTASQRQRIQRLGRILRPAPGKMQATVYTLFGTPEERDRLVQEAERLEGVTDVTWRRMRTRDDG